MSLVQIVSLSILIFLSFNVIIRVYDMIKTERFNVRNGGEPFPSLSYVYVLVPYVFEFIVFLSLTLTDVQYSFEINFINTIIVSILLLLLYVVIGAMVTFIVAIFEEKMGSKG